MKFTYKISSILLILTFILAGNGYSLPESKITLRVQLQSSTKDGAKRQKELIRHAAAIEAGEAEGSTALPGRFTKSDADILQSIVNNCKVMIDSDGLRLIPQEGFSRDRFIELSEIAKSISDRAKSLVGGERKSIIIAKGENVSWKIKGAVMVSELVGAGAATPAEFEIKGKIEAAVENINFLSYGKRVGDLKLEDINGMLKGLGAIDFDDKNIIPGSSEDLRILKSGLETLHGLLIIEGRPDRKRTGKIASAWSSFKAGRARLNRLLGFSQSDIRDSIYMTKKAAEVRERYVLSEVFSGEEAMNMSESGNALYKFSYRRDSNTGETQGRYTPITGSEEARRLINTGYLAGERDKMIVLVYAGLSKKEAFGRAIEAMEKITKLTERKINEITDAELLQASETLSRVDLQNKYLTREVKTNLKYLVRLLELFLDKEPQRAIAAGTMYERIDRSWGDIKGLVSGINLKLIGHRRFSGAMAGPAAKQSRTGL